MHEVGIAQNLIEQVEKRLSQIGEPIQALKIRVQLGKLAGVSPEALRFGFEVAKQNSRIAFAQIEVREIPIRLSCSSCKKEFETQITVCPYCGAEPLRVLSGKELAIESLEYE
jgi:hydrogenase nickel incorporation protein HypA/HybF